MSDYELQVGDPVHVEILKGGYWTNAKKGRIVKITSKRIAVEIDGTVRRFSPNNVILNVNAITRRVKVLLDLRSQAKTPEEREQINSQLRPLVDKVGPVGTEAIYGFAGAPA